MQGVCEFTPSRNFRRALTRSRILVVTALRLKSLYLAYAPDFIYAQSYFGLLSAVGIMAGVILCTFTEHLARFIIAAKTAWTRQRKGEWNLS
jgi:hypothetical protein